MNISYITTYNAADIHQWSGLGYYIAQALQRQNATINLVNAQTPMPKFLDFKARIYNKLGKRFLPEREHSFVRRQAEIAENQIIATDIIFAPSTLPIALVKSNKPKVFYTDATFAGMLNYYPYFSNLCAQSIRHGNKMEQAALDNCDLAIYSSAWAAQTAIDNYRVNPAKIKVVPFGANILSAPTPANIEAIIKQKDTQTCHLLFLGVEWERKGGDIAMETTRILNEQGIPTKLHIAGIPCNSLPALPPYVNCHGYISKSTPESAAKIEQLLKQAHFLILPSRADCTPVVYAEANSFGLPCVTTNTGGIPSIITDNVNGKMFNLADSAEQYAAYIKAFFLDNKRYVKLSASSFNEYITHLNWDASGKAIMDLLRTL